MNLENGIAERVNPQHNPSTPTAAVSSFENCWRLQIYQILPSFAYSYKTIFPNIYMNPTCLHGG